MVYEIIEDVRDACDHFNLRHYIFHFNPERPQESAIQLRAVYPMTCGNADPKSDDIKPVFRRICDGRNAAIWIEDVPVPTQHYLVIYPSIDYSTRSSACQRSPIFVEFDPRLPDYDHNSDYLYELCAVSGTVAVFRNDFAQGQPYIACYRFLDDACQSAETMHYR